MTGLEIILLSSLASLVGAGGIVAAARNRRRKREAKQAEKVQQESAAQAPAKQEPAQERVAEVPPAQVESRPTAQELAQATPLESGFDTDFDISTTPQGSQVGAPPGMMAKPSLAPMPIEEDAGTDLSEAPVIFEDEDQVSVLPAEEPKGKSEVRSVEPQAKPSKRGEQLDQFADEEDEHDDFTGLTPPDLSYSVDDIAPRSSRQAKYRRTLRNAENFVSDLEIDSAIHLYQRTKDKINHLDSENKIQSNIDDLNDWKDKVKKLKKEVEDKIIQPIVLPYAPAPEQSDKLADAMNRLADSMATGEAMAQPNITNITMGSPGPMPGPLPAPPAYPPPAPGVAPGAGATAGAPPPAAAERVAPPAAAAPALAVSDIDDFDDTIGLTEDEQIIIEEEEGITEADIADAEAKAAEEVAGKDGEELWKLDDSLFGLDNPIFDNLPEDDRREDERRSEYEQRKGSGGRSRRSGQERRGKDLYKLREELREKKAKAEEELRKRLEDEKKKSELRRKARLKAAQAIEAVRSKIVDADETPESEKYDKTGWDTEDDDSIELDTDVIPQSVDVVPPSEVPRDEAAPPPPPPQMPDLSKLENLDIPKAEVKDPKRLETDEIPNMPEELHPIFGGTRKPGEVVAMDDPETLPEDYMPEGPDEPDSEEVLEKPQIPPLGGAGGLGGDEDDEGGDGGPIGDDDEPSQKIHGILELKPPEEEDSPFLTLTYDFSKIPDSFELSKDYHSMEFAYYKYKPMLLKAQEFTRRKMLSNALNYYRIIKSQNIPSEFRRMVNRNIKDITEYLEKFLMAKGS